MSVDPLVAFWTARFDETEAAAKSAAAETAADWFTGTSEDYDERSVQFTGPSTTHPGSTWDYRIADRVPLPAAAHIACHDPARVLREVEAKRAILADHSPDPAVPNWCKTCDAEFGYYPCRTALLAIAVYSDHPDYRPEWAP